MPAPPYRPESSPSRAPPIPLRPAEALPPHRAPKPKAEKPEQKRERAKAILLRPVAKEHVPDEELSRDEYIARYAMNPDKLHELRMRELEAMPPEERWPLCTTCETHHKPTDWSTEPVVVECADTAARRKHERETRAFLASLWPEHEEGQPSVVDGKH